MSISYEWKGISYNQFIILNSDVSKSELLTWHDILKKRWQEPINTFYTFLLDQEQNIAGLCYFLVEHLDNDKFNVLRFDMYDANTLQQFEQNMAFSELLRRLYFEVGFDNILTILEV